MKKSIPILIAGIFLSIPGVYGQEDCNYGPACGATADCYHKQTIGCTVNDDVGPCAPFVDRIKDGTCCWEDDGYVSCWGYEKDPNSPTGKSLVCQEYGECPENPGDGGGCPFLTFIHNTEGDSIVREEVNSLLPASETYPGVEITDYYAFSPLCPPKEAPFGYMFLVRETDDKHSWFDQVRLLAVDHPEGSYAGVTYDGKILVWEDSLPATSCVDQNGNDHLSEIIAEDGLYFEGDPSDTLIIGFGNVREKPGWEDAKPGSRVCELSGPPLEYKTITLVDEGFPTFGNWKRINGWKRVGEFYERAKEYHPLIDLSDYTTGELIIRLTFGGPVWIDHIHLIKPDSSLMINHECTLWVALYDTGNVKEKLLYDDSTFAEIIPGKALSLEFFSSDSCPSGYTRSFVFISNGRYETYRSIGTPSDERVIPSGFALSIAQPSPFTSWTDIHYSLPEKSHILLNVYDPTGKLRATLEDEMKNPGRYSILWDGTDDKGRRLPAGTYFIKLQAGRYIQTKKLVLVR